MDLWYVENLHWYVHRHNLDISNLKQVISDGKEVESDSLNQSLKMKVELFDALTSNSEVDHPLCDECSDSLLELIEQQLKVAESEWNDYNNYLKKLESTDADTTNIDVLQKELNDLTSEENRLKTDLLNLKKEEDALKEAIATQNNERERLKNEDEKYWREYTKHRRDLITEEDECRSLECQISYTKSQLEKLKSTNVFNLVFNIWYSGHFGTINNFRLGRLPTGATYVTKSVIDFQ
jgi:beclin 1